MDVVWHYDEFVEFDGGEMFGEFEPSAGDDFAICGQVDLRIGD